MSNPAAHCDDADYLAGDYPRTRDEATAALRECLDHPRGAFRAAVESAAGLLDADGRIVADEVGLTLDCAFGVPAERRAKCATLEAFGRALHGLQDFYSHSNWADEADPARPIGVDNPGLNRSAPSPVLDLGGTSPPAVPADLSTGCYVLRDWVPGVEACAGRITHAGLNKDNGLIDPDTGAATEPTTMRGKAGRNSQGRP